MFIYLASSPVFRSMSLGKIGLTQNPYSRQSPYLTGCPPGLTPSYDIGYDAVWETTAKSREELYDLEEAIHDYFRMYRMMRQIPGDSEWFNFQGKSPIDEVRAYIAPQTWCKREVPLSEILPLKRSQTLQKPYRKNLLYIKTRHERNQLLNEIQQPVISAIATFMVDVGTPAGVVIAPCGSGKTIMTTRGIVGVKRCVICCPSQQIQGQWRDTLLSEGVYESSAMYIVGGTGTTDTSEISHILTQEAYCIITTYMSSHLLVGAITNNTEILVLDEAHHMAGVVASEDSGEGRTRRLLMRATALGIKRLSLTYTPRYIKENTAGGTVSTMDDEYIFGKQIASLKIRELIKKGVLPDYRLWTLRDSTRKGGGIAAKAECIWSAWSATEIVRGEEKHILHHLVVFAATIAEAKEIERIFLEKGDAETLVIRVEEGDRLEGPIARFTAAPRAIIINCFVLNEGVDIPIANAVAITYPKQSRGQITQMVLRAGRWYEGKPLFHVLIPIDGDEDLSGLEEVLAALASSDEQIRDEIVTHAMVPSVSGDSGGIAHSILPECILIEEFEANLDAIRRCFTSLRKQLISMGESRYIRHLCIQHGIETSVDYINKLRQAIPDLPDDPRPRSMSWYDFLHPHSTIASRMPVVRLLEEVVRPHGLTSATAYDIWRDQNDINRSIPSTQHIHDGYYALDNIDSFAKLTAIMGVGRAIRGRGGR